MKIHTFLITVFAALTLPACAEVQLNSLFSDNAVLQRDKEIPVWGTARDGEKVTVEFAGQKVFTVAEDGKWKVLLKPVKANATPQTMLIIGDNTVTLNNILVGDVWVASGQSKMERQLGLRGGEPPIINWEKEAAEANYPLIHEFYVPENFAFTPVADASGLWSICSPQTVKDFSAVGYFFARGVFKAEKIPIGILFTAVGGTPAESWTSAHALEAMPDLENNVKVMRETAATPRDDQINRWYEANDPGSKENWQSSELPLTDWDSTTLPNMFADDFSGVIWFRKEIELTKLDADKPATLNLGKIDDADTTWVNGVKVGGINDFRADRHYEIPASVLNTGRNVIAVRALNIVGPGGFSSSAAEMNLTISGTNQTSVPLAGEWRSRTGASAEKSPLPQAPNYYVLATVLYNAIIAPLQSFPIKGVIWYQGENNNGHAKQYQKLFPLLISDWRRKWHCGEFPFLFVQIAPYRDMTPELREAQFLTFKKSPNTAMAVITDAGDADDIHPAKKQVPGERLALAARALAYGEKIEYSGPLYDSMKVEGDKAMIFFTHIGSGLLARDSVLKGFVIAGADKKFVPAHAEIEGGKVMVWSDEISKPAAVRYGWDNVPDVNLYNKDGLPASPFRTDN